MGDRAVQWLFRTRRWAEQGGGAVGRCFAVVDFRGPQLALRCNEGVVVGGQRVSRIITVRTSEADDGWLWPMSSYPHAF